MSSGAAPVLPRPNLGLGGAAMRCARVGGGNARGCRGEASEIADEAEGVQRDET
jgi:hypothetical protein